MWQSAGRRTKGELVKSGVVATTVLLVWTAALLAPPFGSEPTSAASAEAAPHANPFETALLIGSVVAVLVLWWVRLLPRFRAPSHSNKTEKDMDWLLTASDQLARVVEREPVTYYQRSPGPQPSASVEQSDELGYVVAPWRVHTVAEAFESELEDASRAGGPGKSTRINAELSGLAGNEPTRIHLIVSIWTPLQWYVQKPRDVSHPPGWLRHVVQSLVAAEAWLFRLPLSSALTTDGRP